MVLLWTCATKGRLKLSTIQLHHKTNVGKLYYIFIAKFLKLDIISIKLDR